MAEEITLMPRPSAVPSPTARDIAAVFFRQKRLFLLSFIVVFLGSLLYGWVAPTYQSEMKILARRRRVDPVVTSTPTQPEFTREPVTEEELNSEAALLRDYDILSTVARQEQLRPSKWWWLADIRNHSRSAELEYAIRRLDSNLTIEPVKKSTLIVVHYRSSTPARASQVLQALGAAYMQRHEQVQRPSGEFQFFDEQTKLARQELESAETRLLAFGKSEGVVSASLERDLALQKLSDAASSELKTRVSLAETAQKIKSLESKLTILPARTTTQIRNTDNPQLLEKLKSTLLALELKRTELITKFQPSYRLVQEVDQQIKEAKMAIAAEDQLPIRDETTAPEPNHEWAKSELVKSEVEFSALAARSKAIGTMLASYREQAQELGAQTIQQNELLKNFNEVESRYLLYEKKREEARISDALDRGGILNVTLAEPPTVPTLPVRSELAYAFLGLAIASTCSTGLVFTADYLSPLLRTPDEVLSSLHVPVLASLPRREI